MPRELMMQNDEDLCSFGELLKTFRVRRGLSQQHLAEAMGTHRQAIVRWEQGDFLPKQKRIVLDLAKHLSLDDQETRRFLESSFTAPAPFWSVPLLRNPFFTGREEILAALHIQLGADQEVALTQSFALHGPGGVGKTQIALEYAYLHALEYSAVFWIDAEATHTILSSLLRIAEALQLSGPNDKDQQRAVAAVQQWLSTHSQWLLIWDNMEDLELLDRFLPPVRQGMILITTRQRALGTYARGLTLLPMEHKEGVVFLLRRAKMLEPDATSEQLDQLMQCQPLEYALAEELATAMGGLPLALDQAGAYLEETQCGLSAYLELFHIRRAVLLQRRGQESRDHPASVSTTFILAIRAIVQQHPAVRDLLEVCALLQPDAIPEELFRQGAGHLGARLKAVGRDELEWNGVVALTCSSFLLSRHPEEQTLSMHRLVQAILLDSLTEAERERWTQRAIRALDAVFPDMSTMEDTAWKQCERLLPHALLRLEQAGTAEESLALSSLARKVARYLWKRGRYAEAEPLYLRALRISESVSLPGPIPTLTP